MNTPSFSKSNSSRDALLIFLMVGYAIAFFLYYIDEGNYHFEGLKQPAEWIFLSVYALFFTGLFGLAYWLVKNLNWAFGLKIFFSIFIGFSAIAALMLSLIWR